MGRVETSSDSLPKHASLGVVSKRVSSVLGRCSEMMSETAITSRVGIDIAVCFALCMVPVIAIVVVGCSYHYCICNCSCY